jgi:septal ring factor EnvC (AmiA/AmiB activator)
MTETTKPPWWQAHLGTIFRGVTILIVLVGVIWGGGAWVASQDASAKSTAATLEKIDKRVDSVRNRITVTEGDLKSLSKDNKRLYKVSNRLTKAVMELKMVTSELKALVTMKRGN